MKFVSLRAGWTDPSSGFKWGTPFVWPPRPEALWSVAATPRVPFRIFIPLIHFLCATYDAEEVRGGSGEESNYEGPCNLLKRGLFIRSGSSSGELVIVGPSGVPL